MEILLYILVGVIAGAASGAVGIGGGIIIVPTLVYIFGLSQHQAQGTALAMLIPPIGFLAAWSYYKEGYVDIRLALLLAVGFIIGTLPGAKLAQQVSDTALRKVFGAGLMLVALKMLFFA